MGETESLLNACAAWSLVWVRMPGKRLPVCVLARLDPYRLPLPLASKSWLRAGRGNSREADTISFTFKTEGFEMLLKHYNSIYVRFWVIKIRFGYHQNEGIIFSVTFYPVTRQRVADWQKRPQRNSVGFFWGSGSPAWMTSASLSATKISLCDSGKQSWVGFYFLTSGQVRLASCCFHRTRFTERLADTLLPTGCVTLGTFLTFLTPVFLSMKWDSSTSEGFVRVLSARLSD